MMEKYLYFKKNTFKQVVCVFIVYWNVLLYVQYGCNFGSYPNQFRPRCVGDKLVPGIVPGGNREINNISLGTW